MLYSPGIITDKPYNAKEQTFIHRKNEHLKSTIDEDFKHQLKLPVNYTIKHH